MLFRSVVARRIAAAPADAAMPAPFMLAAIRGEGVLRERFFGYFITRLPIKLDAEQQLTLWDRLIENGGHINDWVQRLGVAQALRREAPLPEKNQHETRQLYALLLHALAEEQPHLLPLAADGFFYHLWRQQFPAQATSQQVKTQAATLREQLTRALRKSHKQAVTVRESFRQQDNEVCFTLLCKIANNPNWQTLVEVKRPRLKTARRAAYDAALADAMTMNK